MGNIVGEPINGEILKQIDNRQKMHGAGYNSESVKRDPKVLNYLNNRNSWIKMASGVSISGSVGEQKIIDIFAQSSDQNYEPSEISNLSSTGLAKKAVLFNTIQSFNDGKYTPRSGVRKDNLLTNSTNKMYGGLGGNSQGLQPVGGITGINVENINRGSIRKATVNIKVYNKFQFNIVELLYLRLGYVMMLEWGWDKYVDKIETVAGSSPKVTISEMGSTIIEESWFTTNSVTQREMLVNIDKKRLETKGNYDAFFGKVANFSWSVNTDGSYDITVDLITLGSVIESLNVRTPAISISQAQIAGQQSALANKLEIEANEETGTYDNSLIHNIGSNVVSQYLGTTILDFPENNHNYINLFNMASIQGGFTPNISTAGRYYIRLGEFLDQLQIRIFKNVVNGNSNPQKQVSIDTGVFTNRCNYVVNLVPLDPSVCIFDFKLSEEFQKGVAIKNSFTKPPTNSPYGHQIKNYNNTTDPFVVETENNVVFGQVMNMYMNINFLQNELDSNVNDKNELSLFQYLQGICNGINKATGNVTNLEPAIKNDNVIYFLEQNPIKGFDSLVTTTDTAPLEILGYNSSGESNFVHDFSFNTKITPDLMSIISIGSTADSTAASIPFNNWNSGLKNRFEEKLETPDINPDNVAPKDIDGLTPRADIIAKFKTDLLNNDIDFDHVSYWPGYDWEWKNENISDINPKDTDSSADNGWGYTNEESAAYAPLLEEVVRRVHEKEREWNIRGIGSQNIVNRDNIESGQVPSAEIPIGQEYKQYLTSGFGGNTGLYTTGYLYGFNPIEIDKRDGLWWESFTQPDFVKRGESSFKQYLNEVNSAEFKNSAVQSSTSGFIPVELGLTVEGLSGINIYNKLSINQKFLPPAYPNALKFVIRGVNHEVSSNMWKTNIETISTSITNQGPETKADQTVYTNQPYSEFGPIVVKGPIQPPIPTTFPPLKILDSRTVANIAFNVSTYNKFQTIDWLIQELNINVQGIWRTFLNTLSNDYPGYTLSITSTYRSYQRSKELKEVNSRNAAPGYSPHNYAYGLDMNVKDPNGVIYQKNDRRPWVESGIPEIATKLGMRWGGDFQSYVDCVHFDATRVTVASIANAVEENRGIPIKDWNTKNTPFV
jgi:hypothetical protein